MMISLRNKFHRSLYWMMFTTMSLGALGCSFALELPQADIADNACVSESDCREGICHADGLCVAASSEQLRIGLFVQPTDELGDPVEQGYTLSPVFVDGSLEFDLTVPSVASVSGLVRRNQEALPARMTFTRVLPFSNRYETGRDVQTYETPVRIEDSNGETREVDYQTQLYAGERYSLRVDPQAESTALAVAGGASDETPEIAPPPLFIDDLEIPLDGEEWVLNVDYPLHFDTPCSMERRDECTLTFPVSLEGADAMNPPSGGDETNPLEGRRFVATAVQSGETVSRPGTIQAGEVSVVVGRGAPAYEIQIALADESAESPYYRVSFGDALISSQSDTPIVVPVFQPEQFRGRAIAASPEPGLIDVLLPDAPVRLVPLSFSDDRLNNDVIVSDYLRTTGSGGTFIATAPAGYYAAIFVPEASIIDQEGVDPFLLELSSTVIEFEIRENMSNLQEGNFYVGGRANLTSTIVSQSGALFPGASVSLKARRDPDDLERIVGHRSQSDVIPNDGILVSSVDRGATGTSVYYDMVVQPDVATNYSWFAALDVPVTGVGDAVVVEAPLPIVMQGVTRWQDDKTIANALVRAFLIVERDGDLRVIEIGQTESDIEGNYSILLPSASDAGFN